MISQCVGEGCWWAKGGRGATEELGLLVAGQAGLHRSCVYNTAHSLFWFGSQINHCLQCTRRNQTSPHPTTDSGVLFGLGEGGRGSCPHLGVWTAVCAQIKAVPPGSISAGRWNSPVVLSTQRLPTELACHPSSLHPASRVGERVREKETE